MARCSLWPPPALVQCPQQWAAARSWTECHEESCKPCLALPIPEYVDPRFARGTLPVPDYVENPPGALVPGAPGSFSVPRPRVVDTVQEVLSRPSLEGMGAPDQALGGPMNRKKLAVGLVGAHAQYLHLHGPLTA